MESMSKAIYIHIPFCNHICYYCDFCRAVYREKQANDYLDALIKEMTHVLNNDINYKTIYIGGGTPSVLSLEQLERLLKALKPYTSEIQEYTIECNPEDISALKASLFVQYGINRVSIGVQTSSATLLESINRKHQFETVVDGVQCLRKAGIYNISLDLIYGLPQQTLDDWKQTLKDCTNLAIPHISLYSLTIEENSVFGKRGIEKADDDLEADMYEFAVEFLGKHGFQQYEVSNFCKEGYQSKHNLTYWRYDDFIGIGLNASGKHGHYRYTNTDNINEYCIDFRSKTYYHINQSEQMFEYIMMNLRKTEGLSLQDFNEVFEVLFLDCYHDEIEALIDKNLIDIDTIHAQVKCRKMSLLNEVLLEFM